MENMMKLLWIVALFLMPGLATAGFLPYEKCKLAGEIMLCKKSDGDCSSVDMRNIKAQFPTVWTPFEDVVTIGLTSGRPSTDQELEDCNNRPVLTLTGASVVNIDTGLPYIDDGATATDTEDDAAGLSLDIVFTGLPVDTNIEGIYSIGYDATDSEGKVAVQLIRTVNVITPPPPPPTKSWKVAAISGDSQRLRLQDGANKTASTVWVLNGTECNQSPSSFIEVTGNPDIFWRNIDMGDGVTNYVVKCIFE